MRYTPEIEKYRLQTPPFRSRCGDPMGLFAIPLHQQSTVLRILSSGHGPDVEWEHVSVSTPGFTPSWTMMCRVKDLFFDEEEAVFQFHPPRSQYVNFHKYCLHLWRHRDHQLILPPPILVGPR